MYGISNETLYANNPQIDADCENIYVGEVLCVDTDAFSYPSYNETLYNVSFRIGRVTGAHDYLFVGPCLDLPSLLR